MLCCAMLCSEVQCSAAQRSAAQVAVGIGIGTEVVVFTESTLLVYTEYWTIVCTIPSVATCQVFLTTRLQEVITYPPPLNGQIFHFRQGDARCTSSACNHAIPQLLINSIIFPSGAAGYHDIAGVKHVAGEPLRHSNASGSKYYK